MLTSFFSLFHLALALNALVKSAQERFGWGIAGGVVRIAFMLCQVPLLWGRNIWTALLGPQQGVASQTELPAWAAVLVTILAIGGPLVSFGTLYMAYRRAGNAPAQDEAAAARPVNAWLAVASMDAIFAVIAIVAAIFVAE